MNKVLHQLIQRKLYYLLLALFFVVYCLNSVTLQGVKIFYLLVPFLFPYYILIVKKRRNTLVTLMDTFIIFSVISLLFNTDHASFRPVFVLFCITAVLYPMFHLKDVLMDLVEWIVLLTPALILLWYILYFSTTPYRFSGFFNDPNYFSQTLNLLIFLNVIPFCYRQRLKLNVFYIYLGIINAFLLVPLFVFTSSRSGFLAFFVLIFCVLLHEYVLLHNNVYRKLKVLLLSCFVLAISGYTTFKYFPDQANHILRRFRAESQSDKSSAYRRVREIEVGLSVFSKSIDTVFFGIGLSSSRNLDWFGDFFFGEDIRENRIHNTFLSVLVENGIIGFCLYITIISRIFMFLLSQKSEVILLGTFLSQLVSSLFIYNITFMPFWLGLFFVYNFKGYLSENRNNHIF